MKAPNVYADVTLDDLVEIVWTRKHTDRFSPEEIERIVLTAAASPAERYEDIENKLHIAHFATMQLLRTGHPLRHLLAQAVTDVEEIKDSDVQDNG